MAPVAFGTPPGRSGRSLVPATIALDTKQSPRIVTPGSLFKKLRHGSKQSKHDSRVDQGAGDGADSLNLSFMSDRPMDISYDDDQDENKSVQSKGSIASLSKLKKGLRIIRKKKAKDNTIMQVMSSPLTPRKPQNQNMTRMSPRRLSNQTESTRSCTSRGLSVLDMNQQDHNSLSSKVSESTTASKSVQMQNLTVEIPAPHDQSMSFSSFKTASEEATKVTNDTLLELALSDPPSSSPAKLPTLQVQKPKTKNLVSAVKPIKAEAPSKAMTMVTKTSRESKSDHSRISGRVSSKSSAASVASSSSHPQNAYFKIFLLLLHPREKVFELIQLFFNPTTTRVRDVLYMIPANATEVTLGVQEYIGLCRPNAEDLDDLEITDLDLLIQNHDNMKYSAQVFRGEILTAIPYGYTAKKIAKLSQQILVNPRIKRLLAKGDPLMPQLFNAKPSRDSRRLRSATSSSRKLAEAAERGKRNSMRASLNESYDCGESMQAIQRAMQKAASAAAAANAAVQELALPHKGKSLVAATGKTYRYPHGRDGISTSTNVSTSLESALFSLDNSVVANNTYSFTDTSETISYSTRSYDNSSLGRSQYSFDNSYGTWSKCVNTSYATAAPLVTTSRVDASMLASNTSPVSQVDNVVALRRKNKRKRLIRRMVVVGTVAFMLVSYFRDPNGFADRHNRAQAITDQRMQLGGLLQVICILLILMKLQFIYSICDSTDSQDAFACPFTKITASFLAPPNHHRRSFRE